MTYTQKYYATKKAKDLGLTLEEYLVRKSGQVMEPKVPQVIDFGKVVKLDHININSNMLKINKTGLVLDTIFSYEGGVPVGTNIMATGDPGVGKTTVLLHTLASLQLKNPNLKCLFVSGEMGRRQMFKYTKRFPIFGNLETIFMSDYMDYNSKDVLEQLFSKGYDYILIDSIAEILEAVKEDNGFSLKEAEKWLVDTCIKNNNAENIEGIHTAFFLIQQVTKSGVFAGSNKVKHLVDAHMEMKKEGDREGGGSYIMFSKNRDGQAGVKFTFTINSSDVYYGTLVEENQEEEDGDYSLNS
jgi:DNA repair protein RadA/Sms